MPILKKADTHQCTLNRGSDSYLPKLPPQSAKWRIWLRKCRKLFLISEYNPLTHLYYRSHAGVIAERKRQVKFKKPYVIHPLSIFSIYRELFMMVVWQTHFIIKPLGWVAAVHFETTIYFFIMDIVCFVDIALRFFTGYIMENNSEMVLDIDRIAFNYINTFLFVDIMSNVPMQICNIVKGDSYKCKLVAVVQESIRFIRLGTVLSTVERVTDFLKYRDATYEIVRLILLSINFIHGFSCFMYVLPDIMKISRVTGATWRDTAKITAEDPVHKKYLESMLQAMCLFFRAGTGMYEVF